ncbi:putative sulfate permease [Tolypocladium ophioglossoides CBS 100239]|uniref:Putative sulfate permease n=1 Tax=Tolypocladium ophioglossoides (strain CBS 100239) TaxID=1163406 RepID=A0A0L0NA69_TOLOC|nr:putative sulfate permease [Tolypocladium ophioglossoides CBS 100239]
MKQLGKAKERLAKACRTDPNINRVKSWVEPVCRRMPSATAEYLAEKLPILQWLPRYDYRWMLQDVIAGITIGVMLIPQGLAYAKIANIPVEHGLYASWLPPAIYFFLGTSKELSAGPTSILGLFTAEAVADLQKEGYKPAQISSAMAFLVGVLALAVGLLKLGFLLDFVSGPVLTGWISAVALVIGLGQVGSLVGLKTGTGTAQIIRDVLGHLGSIKPLTLAIGFTGIVVLYAFEEIGKKWGKRSRWLKFMCTGRAVVVLALHTLISYLVNKGYKNSDDYKWDVTEVDTHGLLAPRAHDTKLLSKVFARCFAPFIAMSVEHLGVGKAFGLRNGYSIDKSQELFYLGVENIVNSFFGALTTGGAMSRTAVNSDCGVRSPLNFIFTAGWMILTLYELAPALYWIPKATLSAIVIMAVIHLISSPRLFYRYWRMSFIDFVASMLGFWVTLFTSTEIGLAAAVGFNIVYTLLRLAFPRWIGLSHAETENNHWSMPKYRLASSDIDVPAEAYLVRFTDDIFFPNAERIKAAIIESIKVHFEPISDAAIDVTSRERLWNSSTNNRIGRIRQRKGIIPIHGDVSPLRYVVFDFGMVAFIDVTGVLSLLELKMELRRYVGKDLQFRFVNMVGPVRERFDRSEWQFANAGEPRTGEDDVVHQSLETALLRRESNDEVELVKEKTLDV